MQRHYFVDYEIYSGGAPTLYGQCATTWDTEQLDPDAMLQGIRQQVADRCGVERTDVRIRTLSRL